MTEEKPKELERGKRRGKGIASKSAKALLMYAKLGQLFAQALEDRGMYSDMEIEKLSRNPRFVRRIVRAMARRKIRQSKDVFSMADEPPERCYTYVFRQGGQLLEMVQREFPLVDYWFKNCLPGVCGGRCINDCLCPPKNTPVEREFQIFEVRLQSDRREINCMMQRSGWCHAFAYDLFHVRNWTVEHPLFALGSFASEAFPAHLPGGNLCLIPRRTRMEPGDRLLVWREKRVA